MTGELTNQPSFTSGEIAPELYGRIDQDLYGSALAMCRNFIVRQYGGVMNRMGTRLTCESKSNARRLRLIPFKFNGTQQYVLEIGHNYMRVIVNGAEVTESPKTITGITQANPGVVTSAAHGFSNGDDVYVAGVVGMTRLNSRTFRVAGVTANTFQLNDFDGNKIDTTGLAAYTSGGTAARIYTLSTPWTENYLFDLDGNTSIINYAQKNDVLTVVHNAVYPQDITRTANTAFSVAAFANADGPFKDINGTTTTVYSSAVTGTVTLTASVGIFAAAMQGDLFYLQQNPDDTTAAWVASTFIYPSQIVRSETNYYQAPAFASPVNISAITAANPAVVTTSAPHGLSQNGGVYIQGVVGMTQVNKKFFGIKILTTTTFSIFDPATNQDINSTAYTAYSSAGTMVQCQQTGNVKPGHLEGTLTDGNPGVTWTYLHSGFGIVRLKTYSSATSITADVIVRLPDNVVGSGGASVNWALSAWSVVEGYPAAVAYHKSRLDFAGTVNEPSTYWMSNTGLRAEFLQGNPLLDDQSITSSLDTDEANAIRHMVPMLQLLTLTDGTEHAVDGQNGVILASQPLDVTRSGNTGASRVKPVVIGKQVLYVQDIGSQIYNLQFDFYSSTFTGIELTARSPHLFRNKRVVDWDYQRFPFSVIWTVMDDGSLLGLTYMDEQKVYAWHRHDTQGTFESVCCVKEGRETATYFVVNRTINGVQKRFVERFATRYPVGGDVRDAYHMDCGLTYDGRNTSATTMLLTGGTAWDNTENLTLTASASTFLATDVGNSGIVYWYTDASGNEIRLALKIVGFTSATVVTVMADKNVDPQFRVTVRTNWEFARSIIFPTSHLRNMALAVLADGDVVNGLVAGNNSVTLPDIASVVHIGLAYTSELQTLDMAGQTRAGSLKAKTVNVPRVFLTLQESRSVFVGIESTDPAQAVEARERFPENGNDAPLPAGTVLLEVQTKTKWSNRGRIYITQQNPLPLTVNCITPEVVLGDT